MCFRKVKSLTNTEKVLTITEKSQRITDNSQRITDNSLTNHSTITVLSHTHHLGVVENKKVIYETSHEQ